MPSSYCSYTTMDHFNECLPDSDKAGTYTHHSLMPSSPSMSCKLQRFFNVSISILLSIQLLMMQKEIILATSGMRIHPSNSFTSRMPYLLSLCYYSAYIPAGGLVFYNLALVYSLLCVLFVLVVEPYRYEYKCHNYLEPCIILSISLILTATTGVNTSSLQSRKYVKPLLMFTALVASLPIVYLCGVTVWWIYKRTPFGYRPVQ